MMLKFTFFLRVKTHFLALVRLFKNSGLLINVKSLDHTLCIPSTGVGLSAQRCRQLANTVKGLEAHWQSRDALGVMYTLGRAAYLDGWSPQKQYDANNAFMKTHFADFYAELLVILEQRFKRPVVYKNDAFLPGFHIFPASFWAKFAVASFHVDLQYRRTVWKKYAGCDFNHPVTFTLSIELPKKGAGIYFFDATEEVPRERAAQAKKMKHDYVLGKMVYHSGHHWHVIAPCRIASGEYRITLQGHAIHAKEATLVYW
jgi:hypothetical protein